MSFKENDFVEIEYTAWDAANNILIVTTDEKKAKESSIYNEKTRYGKVLVVIGSNGVIKGLDKELRGMSVNETKAFTVKADDAFGQRDESLVRVIPLSELRARDINPYPGMSLEFDNGTAIVKSVNSGRVVVDSNNPYAGRDIKYEVKVVSQLNTDKEKIDALTDTYGVKASSLKIENNNLALLYDEKVSKNADYFIGKASAIASVFNYFNNIKEIKVEEIYKRPEHESAKTEM